MDTLPAMCSRAAGDALGTCFVHLRTSSRRCNCWVRSVSWCQATKIEAGVQ